MNAEFSRVGNAHRNLLWFNLFLPRAGCSFSVARSIRCNFAASTSSFCELSKSHHRHKKDYPDLRSPSTVRKQKSIFPTRHTVPETKLVRVDCICHKV